MSLLSYLIVERYLNRSQTETDAKVALTCKFPLIPLFRFTIHTSFVHSSRKVVLKRSVRSLACFIVKSAIFTFILRGKCYALTCVQELDAVFAGPLTSSLFPEDFTVTVHFAGAPEVRLVLPSVTSACRMIFFPPLLICLSTLMGLRSACGSISFTLSLSLPCCAQS